MRPASCRRIGRRSGRGGRRARFEGWKAHREGEAGHGQSKMAHGNQAGSAKLRQERRKRRSIVSGEPAQEILRRPEIDLVEIEKGAQEAQSFEIGRCAVHDCRFGQCCDDVQYSAEMFREPICDGEGGFSG